MLLVLCSYTKLHLPFYAARHLFRTEQSVYLLCKKMELIIIFLVIQIQVAHLQPDTITLVGNGVFPCIGFNLPSQLTEPKYSSLREMAEESLSSSHRKSAMDRDSENQVSNL